MALITTFDNESGQISCQMPDVWLALHPAGTKHTAGGLEEHYNGALVIVKGTEKVHLNALDIADLLTFLSDDAVDKVRQKMSEEHIITNLLRSVLLSQDWK